MPDTHVYVLCCAYDYEAETTKIKTNKAIIHFESQYELQISQNI